MRPRKILSKVDDIHGQHRFENFGKALLCLKEAVNASTKEPENYLYTIALACTYQFTFQLGWRVLQDCLRYSGVDASLPRDVIKQAFHHGIIKDGEGCITMLADRNLMAHVYDEKKALAAAENIRKHYAGALVQAHLVLKRKL